MNNIRRGRGTVGKLFMDTVFAMNMDRTLNNVQEGTQGFKQNMDAAKNSFLLRGFFKKKEREKEREKNSKSKDEPSDEPRPRKWFWQKR
jgi:phospholipid/cholesterol/gamma-HCH transport system substrate-binding protein